MKFFVNFLSAFRIMAAFLIIFTIMKNWPWLTFTLYTLGAISDWFDGYLARKYNCCSKLGGVLDHIGDKLLVCNTLVMLTLVAPTWFVVVPVIIMISRELYISGLREFLGTQKIEMPVPKARFSMGKIKTTIQMIAIVLCNICFCHTRNNESHSILLDLHIAKDWHIWVVVCFGCISYKRNTIYFHIC